MATDDLGAPLGQDKGRKPRRRSSAALMPAIAVVLGLFVFGFLLMALLGDNPFGGEPMVVASAEPKSSQAKPETVKAEAVKEADKNNPPAAGTDTASGTSHRYDGPPSNAKTPLAPNAKTVTIIDGSTGKRQEVVIPPVGSDVKPDAKSDSKSDTKSDAKADPKAKSTTKTSAAATAAAGLDQRLVESSRHGLIPKISAEGARACDVYGHAVTPLPGKPNAPRIAIVLTGLGVSASVTAEALAKLPGPISFALPPYGDDLEQIVTRARGDGHDVLMQVPMEPFEYPDNDPGPQTLVTSLNAEQNIDRLYWVLSRFQGYVGVANLMGARFTASEPSFTPVLREIAKRGLIYVDDGTSPRSIASQVAGANNLPFAKADLVIDAVPSTQEIERALSRLEAVARERGLAVGTAHALPVTITEMAKWAKTAAQRGILLVPISAIAAKSKQS